MIAVALAGFAMFCYFVLVAGVYWEEGRIASLHDAAHEHVPAHFPSA